jgi:hypothetical protein
MRDGNEDACAFACRVIDAREAIFNKRHARGFTSGEGVGKRVERGVHVLSQAGSK